VKVEERKKKKYEYECACSPLFQCHYMENAKSIKVDEP
jgi:hypothetical protein